MLYLAPDVEYLEQRIPSLCAGERETLGPMRELCLSVPNVRLDQSLQDRKSVV